MAKRERIRPSRQQQRDGVKLATNWRQKFLAELADTSNVTQAADAVNANTAFIYKVRREDSKFRDEWARALLEGYENLEMETLHRLRFGVGADDKKFDIANALRLLGAHKETVAREKARRGKRSEAEVLASLRAKIDKMRARKEAAKRLLGEDSVSEATPDARH